MTEISRSEILNPANFELEIPNPSLLDFQSIEVIAVDESLPYRPAKTVEVTYLDGSKEVADASMPALVLKDQAGNKLSVSIAAVGHIDALHFNDNEPGSRFDYPGVTDLFTDIASLLPPEIAEHQDESSAFSVDTGKHMGVEGVATMQELIEEGVLSEIDVSDVKAFKDGIAELNLHGNEAEKKQFIEEYSQQHSDAKIKFQLVRGGVVVPGVQAPKRPTTQLFMVFGPGAKGKTMYTAAPGRYMPPFPSPKQHVSADGEVNETTFLESAQVWFETVMLVA